MRRLLLAVSALVARLRYGPTPDGVDAEFYRAQVRARRAHRRTARLPLWRRLETLPELIALAASGVAIDDDWTPSTTPTNEAGRQLAPATRGSGVGAPAPTSWNEESTTTPARAGGRTWL